MASVRVRSVGLLTDDGLTAQVAEVGCDVYVGSAAAATDVMRLLRNRSRRNATLDSREDSRRCLAWRAQTGPARWRASRERNGMTDGLHSRRRPGPIEERDADRTH